MVLATKSSASLIWSNRIHNTEEPVCECGDSRNARVCGMSWGMGGGVGWQFRDKCGTF